MNKNGFTLIELLAVIMILAIIIGLGTVSYNNYLRKVRQKSFDISVNSMEDAVASAYSDCEANHSKNSFCNSHSIPTTTDTVRLSELINAGYIEKIKNPYSKDENCDFNNSRVIVTRGSSTDYSYNISLSYKTCLICGTKRSDGCD